MIIIRCLFFLLCCLCSVFSPAVFAQSISLYQSVEMTLAESPELQALRFNRESLSHDLRQKKGAYLPSVDLKLGYGYDQYSDDAARKAAADPSDNDWDRRGEAALTVTQKLYDGGETGQQISIQEALLKSADYQLRNATQEKIMATIVAHLDVFRQEKQLALAEKNLQMHQAIYQLLAERDAAGTGNVADVTQVRARLARAETTLYLAQADLAQITAGYLGLTGITPTILAYAGLPQQLPPTLEIARAQLRNHHPEILALTAGLDEAQARVDLNRAKYKPKLNLELSSHYDDQVEADPSWTNSNAAMVNLRWNLFNGGQDRAGVKAAQMRVKQNRSLLQAKTIQLQEQLDAIWGRFQALEKQKQAYLDTVDYSWETFDTYLKQFTVGRRSLLDVLSAENDFFQSATQLFAADIEQTVTAYQILALCGQLEVSPCPARDETPEYFVRLVRILERPLNIDLPSSGMNTPTTTRPAASRSGHTPETAVSSWAKAWATQNLNDYLAHYGRNFIPENGLSRQQWRTRRAQRLQSPLFIDIRVENPRFYRQTDSRCRVEFYQNYTSESFSDRVRKQLILERHDDLWLITREQLMDTGEGSSVAALPEEPAAHRPPADGNPTATRPAVSAGSEPSPVPTIIVGPCLSRQEINQALVVATQYGAQYSKKRGAGPVSIVRLLVGRYPPATARTRLAELKTISGSAFLLHEGGLTALYAGSFHEPARAVRYAAELENRGVSVSPVVDQVELAGVLLEMTAADAQQSDQLIKAIESLGLGTRRLPL